MLSDHILSASTDDEAREVLEALWRKTRGDEYVRTGINHFYAFQATLDARAYLSAAEMLVPSGLAWTCGKNVHHGYWHASLNKLNDYGEPISVAYSNPTPTAWQALAAAIAKTREVAP